MFQTKGSPGLARPGRAARLAIGPMLALIAGGCVGSFEPAPPGEANVVRLLVVQGPEGGTVVFVPVTIEGQGPFAFALDTGASHSVVDSSIVGQLGLKGDGEEVEMSGVAAELNGTAVQIDHWSIEDVPLPPMRIVSAGLSSRISQAGMQGLLGSDVLSMFDEITIDYAQQRLVLR
jgi:hypothetical protein